MEAEEGDKEEEEETPLGRNESKTVAPRKQKKDALSSTSTPKNTKV